MSNDPKPVTDLSPRVVSLARAIDRLPAGGEYVIRVVKPDLAALPWSVEVERVEPIKRMMLEKGTEK